MANAIKYLGPGVTAPNCIYANNFGLGTSLTKSYNDTSAPGATGWWSGIAPGASGYTIYLNKASQGPVIFAPSNDAQLVTFVNEIGATSVTTAAQALSWAATASVAIVDQTYGDIVTNGLIALVDAAFAPSYPRSGSAIYDLSGSSANGTINGAISWVSGGSQSYFNFATAATANYISSSVSQAYLDCTIAFYPDFSLTSGDGSNLAYLLSSGLTADESIRFGNVNGVGPWGLYTTNGNINDWSWGGTGSTAGTTWYLNGATAAAQASLNSGWNILGGHRTNTVGFPNTFPYYLGTGYTTNRSFRGRIAAVLLYNRILSTAEQIQNYQALKGRFGLP